MSVGFDTSVKSHPSTDGSINEASFSWSHTPGSIKGILVFVYTFSRTNITTSVTYGGVSMTSAGRAVCPTPDVIGEPLAGACEAWFLGSSIPAGTQTVTVNRTNNSTRMYAVSIAVTAASDTAVHTAGNVLVQQTSATPSLTEQTPSDGQGSGTNLSMRFAGAYTSANGFALSSPGPSDLSPGTNTTHLQNYGFTDSNLNPYVLAAGRETTAGIGARSVGYAYSESGSGFSEQVAAIHVAIKETGGGGGGTAVADVLLGTLSGFTDIGGTIDSAQGLVFL